VQTNLERAVNAFKVYRRTYIFGAAASKAAQDYGLNLSELMVELNRHRHSKRIVEFKNYN